MKKPETHFCQQHLQSWLALMEVTPCFIYSFNSELNNQWMQLLVRQGLRKRCWRDWWLPVGSLYMCVGSLVMPASCDCAETSCPCSVRQRAETRAEGRPLTCMILIEIFSTKINRRQLLLTSYIGSARFSAVMETDSDTTP